MSRLECLRNRHFPEMDLRATSGATALLSRRIRAELRTVATRRARKVSLLKGERISPWILCDEMRCDGMRYDEIRGDGRGSYP